MRFWALGLLLVVLSGCEKPTSVDDLNTADLILPGGQTIRVEYMIKQEDLLRGMQYRTELAPDHGMLFFHPSTGKFTYWMYKTLIPLDIVWMDASRQIVEIYPNAPPCQTEASKCAHYGGTKDSAYALELAAGMAKKYGLEVGQTVRF